MNQIQIWRLLVDIGLITSVLTLTVRAFKSSRLPSMLPKTRELEVSLRNLIGDAETAGLQLNDQLLRREQNIQRALSEIQQSEARITKAITDAETLQNKLQQTTEETVRVIQDLKNGFERGMQAERARLEEQAPDLHSDISPGAAAQDPSTRAPTRHITPAQTAGQSPDFVQQRYSRTPLERSIEATHISATTSLSPQKSEATTRSSQQAAATQLTTAELQKVYKTAELMLKEGQPLESVASRMKLPLEGVRLLAQMIEIEREEDSRKQETMEPVPVTDSRLGALAAIRRQTSVL